MKRVTISNKWPPAISDGLELPCAACKKKIAFDYRVTNDFWVTTAPRDCKNYPICLPCLDNLAYKAGLDIAEHLELVQFTGIEKTIVMLPDIVYHYKAKNI